MATPAVFMDRAEAGRLLAEALESFEGRSEVVVLALPRGGVPVAFEVAQALHARLDVVPVRKITVPEEPELALGAVAAGGVRLLDDARMRTLGVSGKRLEERVREGETELSRQELTYHATRPPLAVEGKTVILVDDGLATGLTMKAAVAALRRRGAAQIIVAVPVAAEDACSDARQVADLVIAVARPRPFLAVGQWYRDFHQISDLEVGQLLDRAARGETLAA